MSTRIFLTIAAAASVAACSAQSSGGAGASGLYGRVMITPATPTCRVDLPCTRPARGFKLVFLRNGRRAGTAITDKRGRYRIHLPRGRYLVRAGDRPVRSRGLKPATATAPSGRFARRDFTYDLGIR